MNFKALEMANACEIGLKITKWLTMLKTILLLIIILVIIEPGVREKETIEALILIFMHVI